MEGKDNSGALFKNDRKETETHPDYKGECRISGVDYWLSAWLNESKNGKKYMALKMNPKDESAPKPVAQPEDPNDDIPF